MLSRGAEVRRDDRLVGGRVKAWAVVGVDGGLVSANGERCGTGSDCRRGRVEGLLIIAEARRKPGGRDVGVDGGLILGVE